MPIFFTINQKKYRHQRHLYFFLIFDYWEDFKNMEKIWKKYVEYVVKLKI